MYTQSLNNGNRAGNTITKRSNPRNTVSLEKGNVLVKVDNEGLYTVLMSSRQELFCESIKTDKFNTHQNNL